MAKNDSVEILTTKIKLLKGAKNLLLKDEQKYICIAISASVNKPLRNDYDFNVSWMLRGYISNQLGSHVALPDWIRNRKRFAHLDKSYGAMKKYRLQWIDWMIDCLQEDLQRKKSK